MPKDQKKKLYNTSLPSKDIKRYIRQLILDDCTAQNQKRLFNTKILIIGMGGLGIPTALYLVGAGCKNLGIIDGDKIELSNLHRQIAFNEEDIGQYKSEILGKKLKMMNSDLNLTVYKEFLTKLNVNIISDYDLIIDCSDNITTRYLANDYSRNKIFICASVLRWSGEIYVFKPEGACYRCLYPVMKTNPDSCNSAGIIGGICGTIGTMLAVEIVKVIFFGPIDKLMIYDAKQSNLTNLKIKDKQRDCLACNSQNIPEKINLDYKECVRIDDKYKICWADYFKNKKDFDLIDIRSEKLFKLGHIKDSRNIPAYKFTPAQITKKKPVILCNKGISAQTIAKSLLDNNIDCLVIKDGLEGFRRDIDSDFPL